MKVVDIFGNDTMTIVFSPPLTTQTSQTILLLPSPTGRGAGDEGSPSVGFANSIR